MTKARILTFIKGLLTCKGKTLSECALRYFKQSEQIETYLQLFLQAPADGQKNGKPQASSCKNSRQRRKNLKMLEALNEAWNEAVIFAQSFAS